MRIGGLKVAQLNLGSTKTTDLYNIFVECPHCKFCCTKGKEVNPLGEHMHKQYKCICTNCKLVFYCRLIDGNYISGR